MTNQPPHNLEEDERFHPQAETSSRTPRNLYADLCELENLQQAYAHIKDSYPEFGIDPLAFDIIEAEGVENYLRPLSNALRARTYQPVQPSQQSPATSASECGEFAALRDRIVQAALGTLLAPLFATDPPCGTDPDRASVWVAAAINRGLTRAYAVDLEECFHACKKEVFLNIAGQRISDPDILQLLGAVLDVAAEGEPLPGTLASVLANIAHGGIDRILHQLAVIGHECQTSTRIKAARLGTELIVLVDRSPQQDWVLPAARERLREEAAQLKYDLTAAAIQTVDLSDGRRLRFVGFEFRLVPDGTGGAQAKYRYVGRAGRPAARSGRRRLGVRPRIPGLAFARRSWGWVCLPLRLVGDAFHKVHSVELNWHTLMVVLAAGLAGGRWVLAYSRQRGLDLTLAVCGIAALVFLFLVARDVYAQMSREFPLPRGAAGFYRGQYNDDPPWGTDLRLYGLYVPPHFREEKGPFPLLVFLHGYPEGHIDRVFGVGLPHAIPARFGERGKNGRFPFIALFPIDRSGNWQPGSAEVQDAMKVLDHVIERHRIDPDRVYLTGISTGGSGVWRLAETYPDKWAAIAPISDLCEPNVSKIRHIPAWVIHGAKDVISPVGPTRETVNRLREAGADVLYTETNKGHWSWDEMYESPEFYEWLASKKKAP